MRQYYTNNRDSVKARGLVAQSLRTGELLQKPCEICGAVPTDAHHDDYARPLAVRWFCRRHHREHHAALREKMLWDGLAPAEAAK